MPIPQGKIECPDCGVQVHTKNLRKHYRRAHPGLDPHKRLGETRKRRVPRPRMEVSPSRVLSIAATVIVIAMLIIVSLLVYSVYFKDVEAGLEQEDIFFTADDGLVIHATFYHARSPDSPTIYLIHDIGSDRTVWSEKARDLQERGYNVMAMDMRGHGESVDSLRSDEPLLWQDMVHQDFLQFSADITAAYRWVQGEDEEGSPNTEAGAEGAMIGVGKGGLFVLNQVARMSRERMMSAVILSPTLDCYGLDVIQVTEDYGDQRPLVLVSSEGDGTGKLAIDTILEIKAQQDEYNGDGIFVEGTQKGLPLLYDDDVYEYILGEIDSAWGFTPQ